MRDEAVIALILVLVIASAGAGYFVASRGIERTTSVSTITATSTQVLSTTIFATATIPTTFTEISTFPTTSTTTKFIVLNPTNESTSTLSAEGIMLTLSVNASELGAGQKLRVVMSLRNNLSTSNSLQSMNEFRFFGVYVAFWGECTNSFPAEMVILKGTYDLKGLLTYGYTEVQTDPPAFCSEGTLVNHFTFQSQSDEGNVSGIFQGAYDYNQTTGPYRMTVDFSTDGYWNMSSIALRPNTTFVFPVSTPLEYFGGGPFTQPPIVPFTAGNYTVAVSDEWGQYAILHFTVL